MVLIRSLNEAILALISVILSLPNFSKYALAKTNATSDSPTTAAAGTAQVSLRSFEASAISSVSRLTVLSGIVRVG